MDRSQYEAIRENVVRPIIGQVGAIDNYFLRQLWATILDASERSLRGLLFLSPAEVTLNKDINEEDIRFWFKKVSLCFISWIYHFYTMEQRKDLLTKDYLYFHGDSCGGRILDVYEDLFRVKPNCQEVIRYSLGLREDEDKGISISRNIEAATELTLKDYRTIGSVLLENIRHESRDDFKLFLGARLWRAHQQIIQPFLMKNPVGRAPKRYRIVPITYGLASLVALALMMYFFGDNIIAWIAGAILLFFAWSSFKIGLFGSKKLVDELTQDRRRPLSKEADEELKKFLK